MSRLLHLADTVALSTPMSDLLQKIAALSRGFFRIYGRYQGNGVGQAPIFD